MLVNTKYKYCKNVFKYILKILSNTFSKKSSTLKTKKISKYSRDNAKMVSNFYVSIKTIIALSFVYYRKNMTVK